MTSIAKEIDTELREYATLLTKNGFRVYLPNDASYRHLAFFLYSRTVDGKEFWGSVQSDRPLGGYSHHMPLKPSKDFGSSMFVPEADELDPLTVEAAEVITREINRNPVIGTHANRGAPDAYTLKGYTELTTD